jgi:circadian clock protein KaiC
LHLDPWVKKGLLEFHSSRPTLHGLEMHLSTIHRLVQKTKPQAVVLDPIGSLTQAGNELDAHNMLLRLIDFFKVEGITGFLTHLTTGGDALEHTDVNISSLVDTWLLLRDIELGGERNRAMYVLKSRGMAHSNQLREFLLTEHGVELLDVYVGEGGVLTGSSRLSKEAHEKAAALLRQQDQEARQRELRRKREALEARIMALRKQFEADEEEASLQADQSQIREDLLIEDRAAMARSRRTDTQESNGRRKKLRSRNEKVTQESKAGTA